LTCGVSADESPHVRLRGLLSRPSSALALAAEGATRTADVPLRRGSAITRWRRREGAPFWAPTWAPFWAPIWAPVRTGAPTAGLMPLEQRDDATGSDPDNSVKTQSSARLTPA